VETKIIITYDIYEATYYLLNKCSVEKVEVMEENNDLVCKFVVSGEEILNLQKNFFQSEAFVNVNDFRRCYSRLINLLTVAKRDFKQRKNFIQNGGNV
jgi:hypothetical protein